MMQEPRPIGKQLRMINNTLRESWDKRLLKYNLTGSQMEVLVYLRCRKEQETHQREIERWFRLKNPTVTGLLNRLEEKGFISRRTNPADKRYRVIELTEKGHRVLSDMWEEVLETDKRIYECLSAQEQEQLGELLGRILNRLSEA